MGIPRDCRDLAYSAPGCVSAILKGLTAKGRRIMNAKSRDIYQCESCGALYDGSVASCNKKESEFTCDECQHTWTSCKEPTYSGKATCPSCGKKVGVSYMITGRLCGGKLTLYKEEQSS